MIDDSSRYSMGSTYTSQKSSSETREILDHERPQVIPGSNGLITHYIKQGDTLEGIAFRYYQDATKWWIIADVNNIPNPLFLTAGTIIEVPVQAAR